MMQEIVNLCKKATRLNYSAKYRKGNIVHLPKAGRLIVTGDLHGHRRNFERITSFADLQNNPQTYVIFQEILHGGPEDEFGGCVSFNLFFDVIRYQLQFPDQVYLILGNHDTAIISENNVLKAGKEMNQAMQDAMKRSFGAGYGEIYHTLQQYLISQPLAVRCPNRIWVSHSLPTDRYVDSFDTAIFNKQLQAPDVARPKPTYLLAWGRRHGAEALDKLAKLLDADLFILGHQSQPAGWRIAGRRLIILASDHNHGCLISFDPAKSYTIDELAGLIVPLASIA